MVFTDPPYKLTSGGKNKSKLRRELKQSPFTTNGECFNYKTPEFSEWMPLIYRVMKPETYIFIMTNDRNLKQLWDESEKAGFIFCELLVMNKNLVVTSSYFYKSCEFILMFRKEGYKKFYKYGYKNVIDVIMPKKDKIHPTQKPLELLTPIINSCTKENDIILDPFIGSGTTAVAAKNLNRQYIGFELDPTYWDLAVKRTQ